MRNSASAAVITTTNGMVLKMSPSYLPITLIGTVTQPEVLMISICILRFLNRTG